MAQRFEAEESEYQKEARRSAFQEFIEAISKMIRTVFKGFSRAMESDDAKRQRADMEKAENVQRRMEEAEQKEAERQAEAAKRSAEWEAERVREEQRKAEEKTAMKQGIEPILSRYVGTLQSPKAREAVRKLVETEMEKWPAMDDDREYSAVTQEDDSVTIMRKRGKSAESHPFLSGISTQEKALELMSMPSQTLEEIHRAGKLIDIVSKNVTGGSDKRLFHVMATKALLIDVDWRREEFGQFFFRRTSVGGLEPRKPEPKPEPKISMEGVDLWEESRKNAQEAEARGSDKMAERIKAFQPQREEDDADLEVTNVIPFR